jgi:hypothetical protein
MAAKPLALGIPDDFKEDLKCLKVSMNHINNLRLPLCPKYSADPSVLLVNHP